MFSPLFPSKPIISHMKSMKIMACASSHTRRSAAWVLGNACREHTTPAAKHEPLLPPPKTHIDLEVYGLFCLDPASETIANP